MIRRGLVGGLWVTMNRLMVGFIFGILLSEWLLCLQSTFQKILYFRENFFFREFYILQEKKISERKWLN